MRITLGWRGGSVLSITAGDMYNYCSFKDGSEHKLHLNTQSVPRSKHTPVSIIKNESVNAV